MPATYSFWLYIDEGKIFLTKYKKAKWTPKEKKQKDEPKEPPNHISTARVLQESREAAANAA